MTTVVRHESDIHGNGIADNQADDRVEVIDLRSAIANEPPAQRPADKADDTTVAGLSATQRVRRERLLHVLAELDEPVHSMRAQRAREELVLMHTGLVEHIARRYRDRGEPLEDLVQVGMLALVKCAQRFDPHREVEFSTYATATVTGEIKRHFRDRTWAVHVPRRMQELRHLVARATEHLTSQLGHTPTHEQIADHLDISVQEVRDGLDCARAYRAASLDALSADGVHEHPQFACDDDALALVEARHTVMPLLTRLPERERRIVVLRYFNCWSQAAIAAEIGLSQMHVSRLLMRALEHMREWTGA